MATVWRESLNDLCEESFLNIDVRKWQTRHGNDAPKPVSGAMSPLLCYERAHGINNRSNLVVIWGFLRMTIV